MTATEAPAQGLQRVAVVHELEAPQQAAAAHLADDRRARADLPQAGLQASAHRGDVGEHVLVADDADELARDRAAERVARERVAPREAVRRGHEDVATWPAAAMPEKGRMPDVTPLANVTMSGLKSQCCDAEPGAGAPEGRDRLVADQQHLVAVADLAQPLEVAVGRHDRGGAGALIGSRKTAAMWSAPRCGITSSTWAPANSTSCSRRAPARMSAFGVCTTAFFSSTSSNALRQRRARQPRAPRASSRGSSGCARSGRSSWPGRGTASRGSPGGWPTRPTPIPTS